MSSWRSLETPPSSPLLAPTWPLLLCRGSIEPYTFLWSCFSWPSQMSLRPLYDILDIQGLLPWLDLPRELFLRVLISTSSIDTCKTHHVPPKAAGVIPIDKLLRPFVLGSWKAKRTLAWASLWLEIASTPSLVTMPLYDFPLLGVLAS
jgi:hypothetical protein